MALSCFQESLQHFSSVTTSFHLGLQHLSEPIRYTCTQSFNQSAPLPFSSPCVLSHSPAWSLIITVSYNTFAPVSRAQYADIFLSVLYNCMALVLSCTFELDSRFPSSPRTFLGNRTCNKKVDAWIWNLIVWESRSCQMNGFILGNSNAA